MPLHKPDVLAALLARAEAEFASLQQVMRMAQDEATSAETKAEGKYDTRATEASYLAAGQGERLLQLGRTIAYLQAASGAPGEPWLYTLSGARGAAHYLLAPEGGGQRASVGDAEVVVLTPGSPVGEALLGAEPGDEIRVGPPGREQVWTVQAIVWPPPMRRPVETAV